MAMTQEEIRSAARNASDIPLTDLAWLHAVGRREEGETSVEHLRRIRELISRDHKLPSDSTELIRMERERRTAELMLALGW